MVTTQALLIAYTTYAFIMSVFNVLINRWLFQNIITEFWSKEKKQNSCSPIGKSV